MRGIENLRVIVGKIQVERSQMPSRRLVRPIEPMAFILFGVKTDILFLSYAENIRISLTFALYLLIFC
ncbi:hypothetical protein EO98_13835 [Methanosarcina sp. 2.H.T.1A.6]|nr:hypothetical protein EO97_04020 [Methanosarcina sp. 2.H.T.1A.15]KKG18023.1 hypothetical protein EO94_05665 [Methanosarcina sp. 2.H.T.1A.3]KKG19973.1 hypothetical protein EO98_13835 [Methanosarcina sp. 2.H.T.1A.6]KKG22637.1 hypothetical protein EO96_12290 [Methanosarcina sp. 2.H.T.1A.8]